jgi:2-polyprenyl-3-methyl-5-hydroxy-6-metoxy-1,4-benzoquinol methylase
MSSKSFFLHPDYVSRLEGVAFDDRSYRDEWQKEVYELAREMFNKHECRSIVDFGCGSGFKLVKYFSDVNFTGIEIKPALGFLRQKYPERTWRSGEEITPDLFDADMVICSDVIEHLPDPDLLLGAIRDSRARIAVISTPALELLADRGASPRLGPPANPAHLREWSTLEFNAYVSQFLPVSKHIVTHVIQCTQAVVVLR